MPSPNAGMERLHEQALYVAELLLTQASTLDDTAKGSRRPKFPHNLALECCRRNRFTPCIEGRSNAGLDGLIFSNQGGWTLDGLDAELLARPTIGCGVMVKAAARLSRPCGCPA